MQIRTPRDGEISIDDKKSFVESDDVDPGQTQVAGYEITGPENYVIGIESGTPVAPEFRDENGEKLDGSTRVTIQKCDRQGNPLGSGVVFSELLSRFDYSKMRTDPDYFRKTERDLMIDEREIVKVFIEIPESGETFDAYQSELTIGDETSDFGKPVEIVNHDDLSADQSSAVKSASQNGNGGD
jgi:hypothetical protein